MNSEKPSDSAEPGTPDDFEQSEVSTAKQAVGVAVRHFARDGYEGAKLEAIAREADMSKRMIHYHFGDKKGLYQQALVAAIERLHVSDNAFVMDSAVPVEGIRTLVDALFHQILDNPEAVRLIVSENLAGILEADELPPLTNESGFKLRLDRLLLIGQDAGAFRPGISADDIFAMITSISFYRVTNKMLTNNLFGIDLETEENIAGLHRLTVDAVLAFLTSNIPDSGESSYLTPTTTAQPRASLSIYADDE